MEKNKLHVSFEDGFPGHAPKSTDSTEKPIDYIERKKSILASTNTKLANSPDDSFNNNKSDITASLNPTDKAKEGTNLLADPKHESLKSKVPIPVTNPEKDSAVSSNGSDKPHPEKQSNKDVPVDIALRGFYGNPKQYETKIPRFNPKTENKVTKSDPDRVDTKDMVQNDLKPLTPPKKSPESVNKVANTETDKTPDRDSNNIIKKSVYEPPKDLVISEQKFDNTKSLKTESQTNTIENAKIVNTNTESTKKEDIPLQDMKELTLNKVNKQHKDSKLQNSPNPGRKVTHNATNLANRGVVRDQPKSSTPQNSIKEELSSSVTPVIKDSPKVKSDSNKEAVKSKLLLQSTTLTDTKIQSNNANAKNGDVKPSTLTARGGDNANDKQLEQKSTKDKLNVPLTPSHVQNTGKKENVTPSAPGTPRKEKSKLSSLKSSREASPTRTPPTQKVESKIKSSSNSKQESNTKSEKGLEPVKGRDASPTRNLPTKKVETKIKSSSNSKLESNIKTEKGPETVKGQDISPTRTPPFQKVETQVKSLSNSKQESNTKTEKQMDPVTARDIKVEATEINIKTEEEEAKETGDIILNELGEKPKSILSRVALKKIAARVSKSGQNGDLKHVSVNDTLNNSKNSGKFALSVPMSGKKDQGNDKEDNLSMGSRRDSTKYSIDSMSRKSVDIRMQNQVNLVNKQNEEKPKSLLTNTDSMIRSAIPHLPMGVAVLCLIMNILIPGSGTMLSGFAILCCGKPRVHSKDDHVIVTLCVNVWVGVAQLFTITFLLVGWFWSFAWGIRMVILAVEYRKEQQQQREKQLQTMALSAFGSASHMRSLF